VNIKKTLPSVSKQKMNMNGPVPPKKKQSFIKKKSFECPTLKTFVCLVANDVRNRWPRLTSDACCLTPAP
jgi:hypothetical protein